MTAPNLAPGTVVAGKITVRQLLGYGGASATFRAVSQGREVALRVLSPAIGQQQQAMAELQRYVAEANSLPPDRVAHVIDAGYDQATAAPYTLTDIIPMPSLAQLIMQRPMSVEEVGALLQGLAGVIDAAHAREAYHLGIKPTNVFVDPAAPGAVKVTDFGGSLARALVPTQEGYVISVPWMAPEQAQPGSAAGVGADVFAAALVAFFALTGRSYWRSCQGTPDIAAWQREVMSPRTPASTRAAELGLQLNPALDAVFARALAPDPRERFFSISELAAAFRGMPVPRPEVAQTLAFPSGYEAAAAQQQQGYAPPGAPAGQGVGGYPPTAEPFQGQQAIPPPPPDGASAVGMPTQIPPPTIASIGGPPRTASGKAAPIVVGVVAVLLLGGAAGAWYAIGGSGDAGPSPSAAASTSAAPVAAGSGEPTAADTAATGAPTEPPPAGDADAGAGEDAGPEEVTAKITCSPEACEEIAIDDKAVADINAEIKLTPGTHKVTVKHAGFFPKTETITIEAGKPFEKELALSPIPKVTAPAGPAPKPCGKFLKRCK